jgi:cell division protein FtsW
MSLAAPRLGAALSGLRGQLRGQAYGLFGLALALMLAGLLLSYAASPAVAERLRADDLHFATRQMAFAGLGVLVLMAAALCSVRTVRRAGVILLGVALILLLAVALFAPQVKGAARWLSIAGITVQPSEILKPALVIVAAWMLSERMREPRFPGLAVIGVLYLIAAAFLFNQPDMGQALLLGVTLGVLAFAAGVSWLTLAGAAAGGAGLLGLGYLFHEHVRARIDKFLAPGGPSGDQVELSLRTIQSGGLFGRGPGEGVIKDKLPDAHSDFIFAVAAEEFGLIASIGLVLLYGLLLWRGLQRAERVIDPFAQLAASGLLILIGLQAAVHIAVNVSLAPAKGMTLPFVSYGGSSMIGAALTLGFALALLRQRPGATLYETPPAEASARDA